MVEDDPKGLATESPEKGTDDEQDEDYAPSDEDLALVKEVNDKFRKWHEDRKVHEVQWFINAAFYRGHQYIAYDNQFHALRLTEPQLTPPHKKKVPINRIFPKIRARLAKFLRGRPQPTVIPGSTERKDRLNARATNQALDYAWRKLRLESKYRDALLWAKDTGKGFWWINWNPDAKARVRLKNQVTGSARIVEAPLGDVAIEVGSPFEVLVADIGIGHLDDQPEIMRVKMRDIDYVKQRYPEIAKHVKSSSEHEEAFTYERRIAQLTARAEGMTSFGDADQSGTDAQGGNTNKVLVKELFSRPSAKFPNGRYVVVAGECLARNDQELPYFGDMESPYPVVEFVDVPDVGKFWSTTIIEQLIGPQRQYNFIRNKIDQQLRLMMHPKLFTPVQAQIPKNAFHSGAGEVIRFNWIPGLPVPFAWTPPNVATDAWRMIQTLKEEIEDISQIFPSAEGSASGASSGYQTNLLQEASDSVHAPDARAHELTIESAAWKIRRLMRLGYDVPRLLTVMGRHRQAEVIEFHADQIDENADIIVQTGSGLPMLKAARQQIILDWYEKGVFGPPGMPEANRKFLSLAEVGQDQLTDEARKDEDLAQMENDEIAEGKPIPVPQFYEDHDLHYRIHTDQLKSTEVRDWPDEQRMALIAHTLLHFKFMNPIAAANFAIEYGLGEMLIGWGPDKIPPPPPPGTMMPGPPGAPQGQPPAQGGPPPKKPADYSQLPQQLSQRPATQAAGG